MEKIIKIRTCWHSLSISAITHNMGLLYMHIIYHWKEQNKPHNSFHITRAQLRDIRVPNWPSSGQIFHAPCIHPSCFCHAHSHSLHGASFIPHDHLLRGIITRCKASLLLTFELYHSISWSSIINGFYHYFIFFIFHVFRVSPSRHS